MTTATACAQPGCSGTIEDGYCNVCGSPAGAAPRPVAAKRSASAAEPAATGSVRLASAPIGSARSRPGSAPTRRRTGSARTRATRLGAGVTTVPATPVADPRTVVLADPHVPEDKRFCPRCEAPVGRRRGGRPARTEGFCPRCRTPFSFSPKLQAGDLVAGQYAVVGCLAHGGLGWIYLAQDKNVSDRWVVLKGLLNAGDEDAYEAAVSERRFLAAVEHPLIVGIHNFVMHEDAGYIVMEYVGGKSLKSILKDRMAAHGGRYDPFPADQAIAYIVEILPALSYLHASGLLYCDFKPDNVVQSGDSLKLIDLGGVRRIDDLTSAIYGTVGYQAPEVPTVGPSIAADVFTVGRTLAVLAMEFRGYQTAYVAELPPVEDTPLFQRYDSLHKLLLKATAANPEDRFTSADEMREQLMGVLREVVAADRGLAAATQSAPSALFGAPVVAGGGLDWRTLPPLRVDPADPMAAWLAGVSVPDPVERITALASAPETTTEVLLAKATAAVEAGMSIVADDLVAQLLAADPWEWRAVWLAGIAHLSLREHDAAIAAFNAVYGQVPGELAPKLALALACEGGGEPAVAERLYSVCAATDAAYTPPAAFGLARVRAARGDVDGALAALDLVAPTSRAYVDARRERAALLARSTTDLRALAAAVDSVAAVSIDPRDRQELVVTVLRAALDEVRRAGPQPATKVAGIPADEQSLRAGAEHAFRQLAALTDDHVERIRLVDEANRVRPRTLT
ncbi:MAG TPA: tetratricopeptide repeat protein [Mycobacteriales bacterium]|jgi:serine/threonine-protein kinase PknG|nr:tetratricopeptide repeat protein [Mycobacteriales bacterium]